MLEHDSDAEIRPAVDPGPSREDLAVPLAVDLDGTLVREDTSLLLLKRCLLKPWVFFSLVKGLAALKASLARHATVAPNELNYNQAFLDYLQLQAKHGRALYLVSGSNQRVVESVSEHLGLFKAVYASDERCNLVAGQKAKLLNQLFGAQAYDYAGNSSHDLAVWPHCRRIIVVNAPEQVLAAARAIGVPARVFT